MQLRFYPVDITYRLAGGTPVIHLYGRAADGSQVCVIDSSFEPYFWLIGTDREAVAALSVQGAEGEVRVKRTELHKKRLVRKEVNAIKVFASIPSDIPVLRDAASRIGKVLEADILFERRYLIDRSISPLSLCEAEGEFVPQRSKVPVFRAESVKQVSDEVLPKFKILAVDIETHSPFNREIVPEEQPIIMLALAGDGFRKVLTWKRFKTELDYIEFVGSEVELLERFVKLVEEYKPDMVTGYYSDAFDFPFIATRAEKYRIALSPGLDYSPIKVNRKQAVFSEVTGMAHFDVLKFVRKVFGRSLRTTAYDLNSVAAEVLEERKEEVDLGKLYEAWENNVELEAFCKYNMQDASLTLKLAEKLLPNIVELVKVVGLSIDDVSRMGFSQLVEWFLIKEAKNFNELVPNRPAYVESRQRFESTYEGAYVYEPTPGLYRDIAVFDFRSLYPTIISAHNISPDTINCDCCIEEDLVPQPGSRTWFCRKRKGFISTVIEGIITRRLRIKEIMKTAEKNMMLKAREEALKTIANSMYGYLGFFGARWYSLECARSITSYGRHYIQDVIAKAKNEGFNVLYSDSLPYDRCLFVKLGNDEIRLFKIGELYDKYRHINGLSTLSFDKSGKVVFRTITSVIRHEYNGKLLKFITKYGTTITTPQHSVFSYDKKTGTEYTVDAKTLKVGDKLLSLTNPETFVKYSDGHIFDLVGLDFGEYSEELLLYSDSLVFPARRDKCPYCNKEYFLAGHVNSMHQERRHKFKKDSLFSMVGGKNGKTRKIPRFWVLDENLAWLLGYYAAEGSVSDIRTKSGRKCMLSFGSQDRNVTERVKGILDAKTGVSTSIIENLDKRINKKMYYFRVQCLPIVALFQNAFGCGKGSALKKVPWFIFTAEEKLKEAYLRGYLEGDGNQSKELRYKTKFVRFSTNSKELAMGLAYLLKGSKHLFQNQGKEIKHVSWGFRNDKPKVHNLRLQSAKESMENFCLAEIKSITEIESEGFVYDIEVEGARNFVDAEGMILVHNTDSIFLALEGKTRKEAEAFVSEINKSLTGLMELEYEGFYTAGIFVATKDKGYGAKKKYALLSEDGSIKIRGFETVRRNLSLISKDVQEKVIGMLLKGHEPEKAAEYVKSVIEMVRAKSAPVEKLVIKTQLQKEVGSYDAIAPHVAVAQRMRQKGKDVRVGTTISYVVVAGKDRINARAKLPEEVKEGEYDAEYYIYNQIVPAVGKIFEIFGINIMEFIEPKVQKKLDVFFG